MPGIVLGEVSSCSTPLLPFFYQTEGILADVAELSFVIYAVGTAAPVHSATCDLAACSEGGDRLDLGYYVAPLDPLALSMAAGPYDIVWSFRELLTSVQRQAMYRFEVLDSTHFRLSQRYAFYLSSDTDLLSSYALHTRQQVINAVSKEIEQYTGRFFFPRHMVLEHSARMNSSVLWLQEPIIGVSDVTVESAGFVTGELMSSTVDLTGIRVYNRHLQGLLSPDDRENPKIEFAQIAWDTELGQCPKFPAGAKNVKITGAFGYTDWDNTPMGSVPLPLQEALTAMALHRLQDPSGTDITLQQANRIKSAKTRDQAVTFDTSSSASQTTLTGNQRLDEILASYMKPFFIGAAGG